MPHSFAKTIKLLLLNVRSLAIVLFWSAPLHTGAQTLQSLPDWLTFDFTHRTRYETLDNQFRAGHQGGDQALVLYTGILGQISNDKATLTAEMIDARAYEADKGSGIDSNTVDALALPQINLDLDLKALSNLTDTLSDAHLKLGRMTYTLGAGRLIGRNAFRNMPNAFTGALASFTTNANTNYSLFYLLPQQREPLDKASVLDNDIVFDSEGLDTELFGAQIAISNPLVGHFSRLPNFDAEFYVIALNEDDGSTHPRTRNRRLVTLGTRLYRAPTRGEIDFDIEGAWQFGKARASTAAADRRDLDVSAGFVHAQAGYMVAHPWRPHISLMIDYGSGDDSPNDGDYERFDGLYGPVRGDLGPTSLYTHLLRSNLISPGVRFETQPNERLDFMLGWRQVWLDSATDSLGLSGVIDPSGNSGTNVGNQLEFRTRYWILPESLRLEVGGATFFNSEFLDTAPNATRTGDTHYLYADITLRF